MFNNRRVGEAEFLFTSSYFESSESVTKVRYNGVKEDGKEMSPVLRFYDV